jgi:cytochrome c oxidase cbb3-type subunit 3
MPAWPIGVTYTKGLLGIDQRATVVQSLKQAQLDRSVWTKRIESEDFGNIQADPQLMTIVRQTGHALFGDNCAACHGAKARGGKGFPNLTTTSWLWGGTPEAIAETIRVGINSSHADSRTSQMPAFGHDQILQRADIENVVSYVRSLSNGTGSNAEQADRIKVGKEIFAANCASCHGDDARGNAEAGVPNLIDKFWIYGGDVETVYSTVWGGRQGHMPTWESRLSPLDRKILTLYIVDLRRVNQ